MRRHYDAELAALKERVVKGHGYEPYPTLFSCTIDWEQKSALLKTLKPRPGGEGEAPERKKKKAAR